MDDRVDSHEHRDEPVREREIIREEPRDRSGAGALLAVLLLVIVLILFIVGLPNLGIGGEGTQINIPDQFDINIDQNGQPQQ